MFQWPTFGLQGSPPDRTDIDRDDQIEQSFPASDPPSTTPQRKRPGFGKRALRGAGNMRELLRRFS